MTQSKGIVIDGKRLGVRAEFERMTKMEHENESKNYNFCKSEGFNFSKMIHFYVHSHLILRFIFGKGD